MKFHLIDLFWLILLAGLGCLWWLWFGIQIEWDDVWFGLSAWHGDSELTTICQKLGQFLRLLAAFAGFVVLVIAVMLTIAAALSGEHQPTPATETPAVEPPDTDDLDYFGASALEGLIAAGATSEEPTEFNRRARFALRQARAVLLERERILRGDDGEVPTV